MSGVKDRLIQFIRSTKLSNAEFERRVGVSNGYVKNISKSIQPDILETISNEYPELNIGWLMIGKGPMIMHRSETEANENPVTESKAPKTRPRIPYDAAAGSLSIVVQGIADYECEQIPIIPLLPKYDFTMRIVGDSMEPVYHSGDEVACLRINEPTFLQWGLVHILDTAQGIIIKRIYEEGNTIRCVSYNKEYADFYIPKADIFSYNLVVGLLRM